MNSHAQRAISPAVFNFQESFQLRIIPIDGDPWFVAADLAVILEYRDANKVTRIVEADEKGSHNVGTLGGQQSLSILSEPGLYRVLSVSRSNRAKPFQRWLFHEVLPAIRKTGKYEQPQVAEEYITHAQYHELKHLVYLIGNSFHYRHAAQWAAWATLRKKLFAESAAKIPVSRYEEARALLNNIQEAASAFKSAVMELETGFFKRRFSALPMEIKELERVCQEEEEFGVSP